MEYIRAWKKYQWYRLHFVRKERNCAYCNAKIEKYSPAWKNSVQPDYWFCVECGKDDEKAYVARVLGSGVARDQIKVIDQEEYLRIRGVI